MNDELRLGMAVVSFQFSVVSFQKADAAEN